MLLSKHSRCSSHSSRLPPVLTSVHREILDLLGQFLGVISQLDSKTWTRCLLHRSQLSNPRFLGDLLTSFQLISSSLSRGTPLPMIYNPLLERFLRPNETIVAGHAYGFEPTLDERVEGIPSHVTLETVCSIEYLRFSVGISLIYAIVNRMDRMMVPSPPFSLSPSIVLTNALAGSL